MQGIMDVEDILHLMVNFTEPYIIGHKLHINLLEQQKTMCHVEATSTNLLIDM